MPKRLGRRLPFGAALLAGELGLMAVRHLALLDGAQRRRLLVLVRKSAGKPSSLSESERRELQELLHMLEPRLLLGSTIGKLSPMPLPKRLLYGRRDSSARKAAAERARAT